jgi:LCP family protein required for cell wall assembly
MSFEHLDDPSGFVPDDEFRAAAYRGGRRRRSRRRLALAGGSVLTSMAVLVAALAGYGLWRTSQIHRVDVDFAAPPVSLDAPFNVLLIGSDSRAGTAGADEVPGARSDTVIVARIEPLERQVSLLSLPRDLLVTPLGGGDPDRLNAAFAEGGASELVRIVETRLGIPLSAYVEIDFQGLVRLVDEVGGVPLEVSAAVRDQQTGLVLEPASCATVGGASALALLRSRHLQYLDGSGRWVDDPSSDLGRMARQRAVIAALMPELGGMADGLGGLEAAINLAASDITIDDRLDVGTLLAIARWATDPGGVASSGVDLTVGVVTLPDGRSVLLPGVGAPEAVRSMGGELPAEALHPGELGPDPGSVEPISTNAGFQPIGPCL